MIYEKLIEYRKKNQLTQEQLALKLNVSRQTITKWESGMSIPGLDYLMDLSKLYGITIDSIVKEDDCLSTQNKEIIEVSCLTAFLMSAKRNTYALGLGKIESTRLDSHDYCYRDGEFTYIDSYVGSSCFSGEEVVYQKDKAIYSMNYYGKVLNKWFNGDFLKEALQHVEAKHPYRGPLIFVNGDYVYHNDVVGDIHYFSGKEAIYYHDIKVYECLYHGGEIL